MAILQQHFARQINSRYRAFHISGRMSFASFTMSLLIVINEITASLAEVSSFEEKHGYEPDTEWYYRAKKKLRISTQFCGQD